jgi:uncharacterized protein
MDDELPDEVDCRRMTGAMQTIKGLVSAARMSRVGAEYRLNSAARVDLSLERYEAGRWGLEGNVRIDLEACCQRCLEWMPLPIHAEVAVTVFADVGLKKQLGEDYIEAPGGKLALRDLVEDEILLACPPFIKHDQSTCGLESAGEITDSIERVPPFAGLAELIKKGR